MSEKLTNAKVAALKPGAARRDHWDELLPGFGIRVSPAGRKTWVVMLRRRPGGNASRISLGTYPAVSLAAARVKARELLADPSRLPAATTVEEAVAEYIHRDQRGKQRKAWREVEQLLTRETAPWKGRRLATINRRDVVELINAAVDRGSPIAARRLLAHLRRFLTWCVEQSHLEVSPAVAVGQPADAPVRDRVLSDAELRAVWRALPLLGWPWGPIGQLLVLTAQRSGEVMGLRWEELAEDIWTLPAGRTKANREHKVPLVPQVQEIVAALPRLHGTLVFPSRGGRPSSNFPKARLDQLSGASGWRLHDLRRTAASGMAELGVAPHVVGAVLNHSPKGVTMAVYVKHDFKAEKRAALENWAARVSGQGSA